jgi:hypothetical protein
MCLYEGVFGSWNMAFLAQRETWCYLQQLSLFLSLVEFDKLRSIQVL